MHASAHAATCLEKGIVALDRNIFQRITGNTSEVLQFKETLLDVQNLLRSLETLGVTIHVAESIETDLRLVEKQVQASR